MLVDSGYWFYIYDIIKRVFKDFFFPYSYTKGELDIAYITSRIIGKCISSEWALYIRMCVDR